MKRARRIRRRWVRGVALGLTVAAVAVPAAQAYDYHQPFGSGRASTSAAAGSPTTPGPFSHLSRGPGYKLLAGAAIQSNESTVDWAAVGAGIGIGGAFALLVAGLFSMRRPQSGEPVRA